MGRAGLACIVAGEWCSDSRLSMDPWIRFGDELRHDLASRWLAGGTDHVPFEKPRPPTRSPPHDFRRVLRSSTQMAEIATRHPS